MPMSQAELDHLAGSGIVVRAWYADPETKGVANVTTSLPDSDERSLWEDYAFTNGGPLVKLEIVWAPLEARKLLESENEKLKHVPKR